MIIQTTKSHRHLMISQGGTEIFDDVIPDIVIYMLYVWDRKHETVHGITWCNDILRRHLQFCVIIVEELFC